MVDPSESKRNDYLFNWNFFYPILNVILFWFRFLSADRNSESAESVTNEDSSDNNIGPLSVNHNTTTAHDDIIVSNNSNISKNCGKIQTNHEGLGNIYFYFMFFIKFLFLYLYIVIDRPTTPITKDISKEATTPSAASSSKHKLSVSSAKKTSTNKKIRHRWVVYI